MGVGQELSRAAPNFFKNSKQFYDVNKQKRKMLQILLSNRAKIYKTFFTSQFA
jgi:hypothetical protein